MGKLNQLVDNAGYIFQHEFQLNFTVLVVLTYFLSSRCHFEGNYLAVVLNVQCN